MWFKKNKKAAFGGNIPPSCYYCRYNSSEDKILCPHQGQLEAVCKKYSYDPLKREPRKEPTLKTFSKDEFTL